ncbi:ion transporter [Flexithrix dorotheae]|uniref:ion transporter n=1 Tax=Flexithrix dorotheae TaxID=70993 RepID=UPI00037D6601|nr:ion transporter [Flexithrix dorotheae]
MTFKEKVFHTIQPDENSKTKKNRWFEYFITTLITLNIFAVFFESFEHFYGAHTTLFNIIEIFSVLVFTIEYLLRLWTSDMLYPKHGKFKSAIKFMVSFYGLVDLLSILPFYIPFLMKVDLRVVRSMRLLRLLRILKLQRYSTSFKMVISVFREAKSDIAVTLFITFLLLIIASTIMYHLENQIQPNNFSNIGQSFWWAIATLTTVGYGDIYPVTGWGKFISGIIALLGIGVVALPTGIISSKFIEKIREKEKSKKDKGKKGAYKYCPHCGKKLID